MVHGGLNFLEGGGRYRCGDEVDEVLRGRLNNFDFAKLWSIGRISRL